MAKMIGTDVAVIGGGLAGLAAATYVARAGRRTLLFEKSRMLGGRAMTQIEGGFHFNLGPHALYRGGPATQVLRELGVPFTGTVPSVSGAYAVEGGLKHTLPGGFVSLLTTGLLRLPGKFETARLLGSIGKIDASAVQHVSVRDWLDRHIRQADVRRLVQALFRVSTYANAPAQQSAGSALEQLQLALSQNVMYLDGGWQVLVDGLRATAEAAGVEIVSGTRVESVDCDTAVRGVRLAGGTHCPATAVIMASSPADAAALVPETHRAVLRQWDAAALPVRAACLDLGLRSLPRPGATFGLGIDRPLYLSVHSAVAKLAPAGAAMIHVAKYLPVGIETDPQADERELEGILDTVQSGWREQVIERRFLPSMTVCHALLTAAAGGAAGRPGPAVPNVHNLYVAGDWVGPEGLLADASLASAKRTAQLIGGSGAARDAAAA
jgi:phytoene dehydrogenase-like protein